MRTKSGGAWNCRICEGRGWVLLEDDGRVDCEMCDGSGRRYRETLTVDGTTVSVTGSGPGMVPGMEEAMMVLARAAFAKMDAERAADGHG